MDKSLKPIFICICIYVQVLPVYRYISYIYTHKYSYISLLRYSAHIMQFTYLEYMIQWFSVHSQSYVTILSSWASHCNGFSCCRAWALGLQASVVVAHRLSCPARSIWDLPRSGIKPMSTALAGRFLTTGPLGKPKHKGFSF